MTTTTTTNVFAIKKQNLPEFLEACQNHVFLEMSEYEKESIDAMLNEYNDNPIVPGTVIAFDEANDRLYAKKSALSHWAHLTPQQLKELLKFFAELGTYANYWCDVFAGEDLLTKDEISQIYEAIEETY